MTRIYLSGPAHRRTQARPLTIDLAPAPSGFDRVYVEMLRHHYRRMRRSGMSDFSARIAVYEILSVGIRCELGEGYR